MAELSDLGSIGRAAVLGPEHDDAARRAPRRAPTAPRRSSASIHARETDPELGALLDALEPWAAGEDPDSDDVRLVRWARRDHEKSVRVPAELAAEITKAQGARPAGLAGGARGQRLRPLPRRARSATSSSATATSPASTGYEHPYDVLLDDFEPGLTTAELRPLFAELREALVPLVAAAGDPDQPRNDGALHGTFGVDAQRAAVLDVLEARRLRPGRAGAWTRAAPVRAQHRARPTCASPRSTTRATSRWRSTRRCTSSATASTRRRSTARLFRTTLDDPVVARRARVAEPAVGERRRPLAAVLRVAAAAAAASRCPAPFEALDADGALPRREHGPAVADPDRGRRDDLQPAHRPALRARAGADRGHADGRRPARTPGTRGCSGCSASRSRASPRASSRTSTGAPG